EPKIKDGRACSVSNACDSGFCADGVCCGTACGNSDPNDCQTCNQRGNEGRCLPLAANTVCRASGGVCDEQEVCNGSAVTCPANQFVPAGKTCRAASC